MEFEVLKRTHLKRNILIGVLIVGIITTVVLNFTRAKYRVTQSIPLVNGTINYTPYDFKMIAMYQMSDTGEYVSIDQVPTSGYALNTTESYCEIDGEKDGSIPMTYENGRVYIGVNTKGTKCFLYFDEKPPTASETILANKTISTRTDFSTTLTTNTTGTIYYEDASKGGTYYFAGNPTDNWVKFAGFYWRIIRINEDGTIRMIYQGTSANTTGTGTQIGESTFNDFSRDNMYVGYMYESNQAHGIRTSSAIKEMLDTWYQNNLINVADKINGNAGFCGDRTLYSGTGTGTTESYYEGYIRLVSGKSPTFDCAENNDLYTTGHSKQGNDVLTYPIGLITADAGGVTDIENTNYYLYTGQTYWTMTPSYFGGASFSYEAGYAFVFRVSYDLNYGLGGDPFVSFSYGVRPVINLRADVSLSGSGTSTDPYIVN